MNKNLPVEFNYNAKSIIRTVLVNKKPHFVAKDICDLLEIQNTSQAVSNLDDDEKLMYVSDISGQNRETLLINDSGLYALIIRSNKPEARKFRKWITSEVIPSLMKEGKYEIPDSKPETKNKVKPSSQTKALENPNRIVKIVNCFMVRVEVYGNGEKKYSQVYLNPEYLNYETTREDLEVCRQIIDSKIGIQTPVLPVATVAQILPVAPPIVEVPKKIEPTHPVAVMEIKNNPNYSVTVKIIKLYQLDYFQRQYEIANFLGILPKRVTMALKDFQMLNETK